MIKSLFQTGVDILMNADKSITGKSVVDVIASFTDTVNDLNAVAAHQEAEAARFADIAIHANRASLAAVKEAALARDVAAKLSALIEPAESMSLAELKAECAQ